MKNEKYIINFDLVTKYVKHINTTTEPISQVKIQFKEYSKMINDFETENINELFDTISKMYESINSLIEKHPNKHNQIFTNIIKQIMFINNGIISSRLISPLNISRQYLSILEKNGEIERVARGIYQSPDVFEDSYYSFQSTYKKTVFSHMNALYFWGMTEEVPYMYTVTVPQNYHANGVNEKCNVFYVEDDLLDLGLCEVQTPNGNKVRAYDIERSICDIFRSKNRMDPEQVHKSINCYLKSNQKNINKLLEYSLKMGIKDKILNVIGEFHE